MMWISELQKRRLVEADVNGDDYEVAKTLGIKRGTTWRMRWIMRAAESMIRGTHTVRYLPPYSPFCNICDNIFSAWKAALRRSMTQIRPHLLQLPLLQQLQDLCQLGEHALSDVTTELCTNWFYETQNLIPRMMRREDMHAWFWEIIFGTNLLVLKYFYYGKSYHVIDVDFCRIL